MAKPNKRQRAQRAALITDDAINRLHEAVSNVFSTSEQIAEAHQVVERARDAAAPLVWLDQLLPQIQNGDSIAASEFLAILDAEAHHRTIGRSLAFGPDGGSQRKAWSDFGYTPGPGGPLDGPCGPLGTGPIVDLAVGTLIAGAITGRVVSAVDHLDTVAGLGVCLANYETLAGALANDDLGRFRQRVEWLARSTASGHPSQSQREMPSREPLYGSIPGAEDPWAIEHRPEPFPPEPCPPPFLDRCELEREACMSELVETLRRIGLQVANYPPFMSADGISSISPTPACVGVVFTIHGMGFGAAQPPNIDVVLPTKNGCEVMPPQSWTNTAITVELPPNGTSGCVGFVDHDKFAYAQQVVSQANSQIADLSSAVGCIGVHITSRIPEPVIGCPPCSGANRIEVGRPSIDWFHINGGVVAVDPGTVLELSWRIRNASTVEISRTSAWGPDVNVVDPPSNRLSLGPFNSSRVRSASYRLTATNACGSVSQSASVYVAPEPTAVITGVEFTQGIQHFRRAGKVDNSVPLVAQKNTVVRLYCESDIDTFSSGRIPDARAEMAFRPVGANSWESYRPAANEVILMPPGQLDRSVAAHTFNFVIPADSTTTPLQVRFEVAVDDFGGRSSRTWREQANDVVNFFPVPPITIVIVRIPFMGVAPTLNDCFSTALSVRALFPITWINFALPSIEDRVLTTSYDLRDDDEKSDALGEVDKIKGRHKDHGEFWMGFGGPQNGGGVAYTGDRVCVSPALRRSTTTHELGHAHGLHHIDVGNPDGPHDPHSEGGMVLDVPFDIDSMSVPFNPSAAGGINDIMGYVGSSMGRWTSWETWLRMIGLRHARG